MPKRKRTILFFHQALIKLARPENRASAKTVDRLKTPLAVHRRSSALYPSVYRVTKSAVNSEPSTRLLTRVSWFQRCFHLPQFCRLILIYGASTALCFPVP